MHAPVEIPQADKRVCYALFEQRRYARSCLTIHTSATSQIEHARCTTTLL